jgi:hypothetical protein
LPGIAVSHGPECSVALVAASYDDPGVDDAEFVELRVDGSRRHDAGASQLRASLDAGSDGSAGNDAGASPTLASCGLAALDLVDGANGGCATYRHIPLGAVPIPADGYVVLCTAGSTVDARAHCDVTTAGSSALRGGWLQNGPNDGFRFVPVADGPIVVAYEGSPACFPTGSAELSSESGAYGGDATIDDVNVACGGRFVLLSEGDVPLRAEPACPAPIASGFDAAVGDTSAVDGTGAHIATDAGLDAAWTPERAPTPANRGPSHTYGPLSIDAGPLGAEPSPRSPPKAPGCGVARAGANGHSMAGWFIATFVVLALLPLRRCSRRRARVAS